MQEPTHVFGQGARDYAAAKGWTSAAIIEDLTLNPKFGADGLTEETRRVIAVAPGHYKGVAGFVGKRRFVNVLAPDGAKLEDMTLSIQLGREFVLRGFEYVNTAITFGSYAKDGPTLFHVSGYQHSMKGYRSGVANASDQSDYEHRIELVDFTQDGVGSTDNHEHGVYVHGRPNGRLIVRRYRGYGARGCSLIKSDARFCELMDGETYTLSQRNPEGPNTHTHVDLASACDLVMDGWMFDMYRWRNSERPSAFRGTQTAGVFMRNRREIFGDDSPVYGSPEFWDDAFWARVRSVDRACPVHPYTRKHFFANISAIVREGSQPLPWLADHGLIPTRALSQFGLSEKLANHPLYTDRAVNFLNLPTINAINCLPPDMTGHDAVGSVQEGAIWPRTSPLQYPLLVHLEPQPLVLP
jgi:hypothetical protein